jgi:hypothetical protein
MAMAHVNYSNGEIWMGGGLTWNYWVGPIDARYNDVSIITDPGSQGPDGATGNVQITAKWVVSTPQQALLFFTVQNNSANSVWFDWNLVNVTP